MKRLRIMAILGAASLTALGYLHPFGKTGLAATTGGSDAARGEMVFEKRCTGCHAMEANREGPRLAGVYGRRAGSVPGFDYSQGLKSSGLIWNDGNLEKWLSGQDSVVPDAKMDFYVPQAQERRDLIAYFKRLAATQRNQGNRQQLTGK